ncbi:LacI family DNA-binding transcriptional regulator [Microbacterium sp. NPDC087589]|uniref:LacI family DNA-binding transcriptional regulator n=1 Tax=Microbacterium sp. NPDC087589 TaxID=3364191 RepID=UPI0038020B59
MTTERRPPRSLPTSKDVAALAGVSQSTVSYVMSGKRAITPETRRRVEDAIRELTYQPNAGARALRGSKTNVIALVVHLGAGADVSETSPYIDTIVEEARGRDYDVVLVTTDEGPQGLERLAARRVADAFVLMDVRTADPRLESAAALGLPVVLFGRPEDPHGLDAVDFDTRRAAELLVDELATTGHRRVVVVGNEPEIDAHELRFIHEFHEGARHRAAHHNLEFSLVHPQRGGWAGIEEAASDIFANHTNRLGLIARTPRVTEWLIQLARLTALTIGRDISLLSLCTDATARQFEPAITNVSPQPRDLSRLAMRVLFKRIEGDADPTRLELVQPAQVSRRQSTTQFS